MSETESESDSAQLKWRYRPILAERNTVSANFQLTFLSEGNQNLV